MRPPGRNIVPDISPEERMYPYVLHALRKNRLEDNVAFWVKLEVFFYRFAHFPQKAWPFFLISFFLMFHIVVICKKLNGGCKNARFLRGAVQMLCMRYVLSFPEALLSISWFSMLIFASFSRAVSIGVSLSTLLCMA